MWRSEKHCLVILTAMAITTLMTPNSMTTFGIVEAEEDTCPADVDGDGSIGFSDVLIILNDWGACP